MDADSGASEDCAFRNGLVQRRKPLLTDRQWSRDLLRTISYRHQGAGVFHVPSEMLTPSAKRNARLKGHCERSPSHWR